MQRIVQIIDKQGVFYRFLFRIEETRFRHQQYDGTMSDEMARLNLERGDSVAALVHDTDSDCVILAGQFRYPTYEKGPGWILEIPAGILEPDESPQESTRREVLEEIGDSAGSLRLITSVYVSPGGSSERIQVFYVPVAQPGVNRTLIAESLPELLRKAGYRTIHVGKAPFAAEGTPSEDPRALGFDVNMAGHCAGAPGSYQGLKNFARKGGSIVDVPGLDEYHDKDIKLTDSLTIEARKALDAAVAEKKPFYLYMSHYAVDGPWGPDNRFIEKYRTDKSDCSSTKARKIRERHEDSAQQTVAWR